MKKFIFFVLIIAAFSQCKKQKQKINEDKIHASTAENTPIVEIEVIKPQTWYTEILSQGKLLSIHRADLRFKIAGQLQQIKVHTGQVVSKNQFLASLDSSEALHRLQLAEVAYRKAKTERYIQLIQRTENGDTASVPPRKKAVVDLTTGYSSAMVNLQQARYNFKQTKLFAPFSGLIANLFVQNYNYIQPTEIFCTLIDNSQFYLDFKVLESEIHSIHKNSEVNIHPLMSSDKNYKGTIVEINPQVDKNGMISIRAIIPHSNELTDGMQMEVSIRKKTKNQIVVPKSAVIDRSEKAVAFVYHSALAKWHYIKISGENASSFHISNGLEQGDTLIISNNFNLVHDSEVRLMKN